MKPNPIEPALARLREAARHWSTAASNYHDPEEFRIALNACIQSIRNVTFALQNKKKSIPGFDDWYPAWQEALRSDTVMRWCVEARNQIVKQQDLETHSMALASLVVDYGESPKNNIPVNPFASSQEIALSIRDGLLPEHFKRYGYLYVERRWIVTDLADVELLEALAYALSVLRAILLDAITQKGPASFYGDIKKHLPELIEDGAIDEDFLPEFVREFREARSTWLKLSSMDFVRVATTPLETKPAEVEEARLRYRLDELTKTARKKTGIKDLLEHFISLGKRMLEVDGYHAPKVFLFDRKGRVTILEPEFPEHEDKPVIWSHIAKQAKREKATSVMVITEAWFAPFDEALPYRRPEHSPDRKEALQGAVLTNRGESYAVVVPFTRDGETIGFSDETTIDAASLSFFEPFRRIWRKTMRA